jgi:hypothetical protein
MSLFQILSAGLHVPLEGGYAGMKDFMYGSGANLGPGPGPEKKGEPGPGPEEEADEFEKHRPWR